MMRKGGDLKMMNILLLSLALSGFAFAAPTVNVAPVKNAQEVVACEPCMACPAMTVATCEPCDACE